LEGVAVKQTVSAPVAIIAIALCALVALTIFTHRQPPAEEQQKVAYLPPAPPLDDQEVQALRKVLFPLGVATIMPPLATDRFKGARLALVASGSPAATGGLQPGDLVVEFGGTRVDNPYALAGMVAKADPKKTYDVVVERAGKKETLKVTGVEHREPPSPL
jgi:membrane-associated protease RseP (regulator of RpoE activity)